MRSTVISEHYVRCSEVQHRASELCTVVAPTTAGRGCSVVRAKCERTSKTTLGFHGDTTVSRTSSNWMVDAHRSFSLSSSTKDPNTCHGAIQPRGGERCFMYLRWDLKNSSASGARQGAGVLWLSVLDGHSRLKPSPPSVMAVTSARWRSSRHS